MKCKACNGTGKINAIDFTKPDWKDTEEVCPICCGKGTIEQTNEEYMQTCNSIELGCFICENFFRGACGKCGFCEKTELRHHCILGEWLKEKHQNEQ